MQFKKKDKFYARSDCGRFQISSARVEGKLVYSAWDLKAQLHNKPAAWLVAGVTLQAAKQACRKELNNSERK